MNLSKINQEVEEEVNRRQAEIIGSVFDSLKSKHAKRAQFSNCDCSYCVALRRYVAAKLRARRLQFRTDFDDAEVWIKTDNWSTDYAFYRLETIRKNLEEAKEWRARKNSAKYDL